MDKTRKRLSFIPKHHEEEEDEQTQYQQEAIKPRIRKAEEPIEEPEEEGQEQGRINPHQLYREMIEHPVPKGILKETLSSGRTLDFSCLEKYQIFAQSPKQMRTYLRNQKSVLQEEIRGFTKRHKVKFGWGFILIMLGAGALIIVALLILSNPDAITDFFNGIMP